MLDTILSLPVGFWVSLVLLATVTCWAWSRRHEAWGIPAMAACGTVVVWYHGDALYNDYRIYSDRFALDVLDTAWWQVTWFIVCFAILAPLAHRQVNGRCGVRFSRVAGLLEGRQSLDRLQRPMTLTFQALAIIWLGLSFAALLRTEFDMPGLFLPWLGHKAHPWARGRTGGGIDFLLSLANYIEIFCLAGFGVALALTRSPRVRVAAFGIILLSWPSILLDRNRNTILAVVLPAILCFVFFRLRRRPLVQLAIVVIAFLAVDSWFHFVLAHRSEENLAQAFAVRTGSAEPSPGTSSKQTDQRNTRTRHLGLSMYEELCWINTFLRKGTYRPNWGYRYYAELVNPIPRTLWAGKPLVGFDYAIARGQGVARASGQVYATISTGLIGQGVVNFGPWGGPPAAALLMSIWVAVLARFDLNATHFGRLPLYALGLVLTFNLGRDITLLVAYPLLFGYLIVRFFEAQIPSR